MKRLFAALCLLLVVGNASAQEPVIQPGDAVLITVWRNPELSGEFQISEDGAIQHPLFQGIKANGITRSELTSRLAEVLSRFEASPQFVVVPLLKVGVGGEVRQPNLYRLPIETTVAEAVAMAGGVTERGKLDRVRLLRGSERQTLNLLEPAGTTLTIRSGDQIFVERRRDILREYVGPIASVLAAVGTFIRLSQ